MTRFRSASRAAALGNATLTVLTALIVLGGAGDALAYPVDGEARTGIRRLAGTTKAQQAGGSRKLPPGALLGTEDIALRLEAAGREADLGEQDATLKAAIDSIFAPRDPSYAVAVVDITNPAAIAWAGRKESVAQYPGSVGKVACAVALLDGLRRAFPEVAVRERMLRETVIPADAWSAGDSHSVPVLDPASGLNRSRPVRDGDAFTMSEWLDHALSASANSAGSIAWREAMLLRALGAAWPGTKEQRDAVLARPGRELHELSQQVIREPLAAAGLDPAGIVQGTFWTKHGQARVPGSASSASPRALALLLLRVEQGRVVDSWSSLELKRYLYLTRRRYRYAYAPELNDAAVFFKSGSLYSCVKEEGFACGKYRGNGKNFMNSIAIIETPARPAEGVTQRRYLVALMSNVLKVNSAWDHSRLAAAIDEAVRTRAPTKVQDAGPASAIQDAGRGE